MINLPGSLASVPTAVWVVAVAQVVMVVVGAVVLVRARRRSTTAASATSRRAMPLLVLALLFCSVVLAAFVIGTYEGSTAFAADKLGWGNWRKVIPWAALDAGGFGFGLFWIRAVAMRRSPVRPRRVVYVCAGFSAFLQMIQGGQNHRWQAGLFLAFLAAIGGLILHTLVDQLRDGDEQDEADWHKHPPFGLRWLTYTPNTLRAWLAWINFPAAEGTVPTVSNALANLDRVRAGKLAATAARLMERGRFSRWTMIAPWVRPRQITAVITSVKIEAGAKIDAIQAEHAEQISKVLAEQSAAADRSARLAADLEALRDQSERHAEQLRTDHAERVQQILAEHAEQMAVLRAEQALGAGDSDRSGAPRSTSSGNRSPQRPSRSAAPEQRTGAPKLTDEQAVAVLIAEHPEHDYEWGSREVHRITGAGFGRIPKLIAAVAEHHARERGTRATGAPDRSDPTDEERAI